MVPFRQLNPFTHAIHPTLVCKKADFNAKEDYKGVDLNRKRCIAVILHSQPHSLPLIPFHHAVLLLAEKPPVQPQFIPHVVEVIVAIDQGDITAGAGVEAPVTTGEIGVIGETNDEKRRKRDSARCFNP